LDEQQIPYHYREYRQKPLSVAELKRLTKLLGLEPRQLLRRGDRSFKELGLTGEEPAEHLLELMAEHPTLLQRPIAVVGDRAVVGRPPEKLLTLVEA
jgi:arsenate reductase